MGRRLVTAAVSASLVAASCSGCFVPDEKVAQKTARITIDNDTRTSHAVTCSQVDWRLIANITAAPANVRVLVTLDPDKPTLESVNFDDFAGFSGVANVGDSKIRFANDTYTITGTADGSQLNDPRISVTRPFKVEVGC